MPQSKSDLPALTSAPTRGFSDRALANAILKGELPREAVCSLPPQTLYMALKQADDNAYPEVIELASLEQCRLILDFDLWEGDRLNEDNFWHWLSLTDDEQGLKILQKLIRFVDLKLISLLITRYVKVVISEEPTEGPPAVGFYTPDKGHTWINVTIEDADRHFYLSRLLALIFETSAPLFYQLLATPGVATDSMLEEESFSEREKRLASEGIPDADSAAALNSPLSEAEALTKMADRPAQPAGISVNIIDPLVSTRLPLEPLTNLMSQIKNSEDAAQELTYLMNAALSYFRVNFYESEEVAKLAGKVRGAINIGLESAQKISSHSALEVYEALGFRDLYRLGLGKVTAIGKASRSIKDDPSKHDSATLALLEATRKRFPEVPAFFDARGPGAGDESTSLQAGTRPIEKLAEVEALVDLLKRI